MKLVRSPLRGFLIMLVWVLICASLSAALIISSASSCETNFMPEEEFNDEGGGFG